MDKFEELLRLQKECDDRHQTKLSNLDLPDQLLSLCRAMSHEIVEVESELNWKWWKYTPVNMDNVQEEMIDILFFWLSAANKVFGSPDVAFEIYKKKWDKNMTRKDFTANE